MITAQIAIFYYIVGRLFFLTRARFDYSPWPEAYYIWDAGKDALFALAVMHMMRKENRWVVHPVLIFCIIRLIWEIINPFTTVEINHPKVVVTFFLSLLIGVVILLITDLKKRWKQN